MQTYIFNMLSPFPTQEHIQEGLKETRMSMKLVMFYSLIVQDFVFVSEPRINASDQEILQPKSGQELPITLQCNLTNSHSTHRETFWMKNGQEIPNTRTEHKHTEFK